MNEIRNKFHSKKVLSIQSWREKHFKAQSFLIHFPFVFLCTGPIIRPTPTQLWPSWGLSPTSRHIAPPLAFVLKRRHSARLLAIMLSSLKEAKWHRHPVLSCPLSFPRPFQVP
jgi:hypothetical protein